jgi:hypothetical protein
VAPTVVLDAPARCGKEKNRLLLRNIEPRFLGRLAHNVVSVRTKLFRIPKDICMPGLD